MGIIKTRKAIDNDIESIWQIITDAKRFMAANGRSQWTESYPTKATICTDIHESHGYIACACGRPVAYACIATETETAYNKIKGQWLTTGRYVTIHRLAVSPSNHGM